MEQDPGEQLIKIKKDFFDIEADKENSLTELGVGGGLVLSSAVIMAGASFLDNPGLASFAPWLAIGGGGYFVKSLVRFKEEVDDIAFTDPDLHFQIHQCVYKGKGALGLRRGDNFMMLIMPSSDHMADDPELGADLLSQIVKESKTWFKQRDYRAVFVDGINTPGLLLYPLIEEAQARVSPKSLMQGKNVSAPDNLIFLGFSPDNFDKLTAKWDMDEKLKQALLDLQSPTVLVLIEQYKSSNEKEKQKIILEIEKHLFSFLQTRLESLNNAGLILDKDNGVPVKSKDQRVLLLMRGNGKEEPGSLSVRLLSQKGEYIDEILDRFLPENESSARRLWAAYTIYKLIKQFNLEDLLKQNEKTREDLLQRLKRAGWELRLPDLEHEQIIKAPTYLQQLKRLIKGAVPALGIGTAVVFLSGLISLATENIGNPFGKEGSQGPSKLTQDLPGNPRDNILIWDVGVQPGGDEKPVLPSGYYTESTGDRFSSSWQVNTQIQQEIIYPHTPNPETGRIKLRRLKELNTFGETSLKIPIKDGTKIEAIRVEDLGSSHLLNYRTYLLTDGTVQLLIENRFSAGTYIAEIEVFLTEGAQVKASGQIKAPDLSKLDTKLQREVLEIIKNSTSPQDQKEKLAEMIAEKHLYSVNPRNRADIKRSGRAEAMINLVANLPECDCYICNSQLAALSGLDQKTPSAFALGYFYNLRDNPGSTVDSHGLTSLSGHGYLIDGEGKVYDATPSKIAGDELTLKYLEKLKSVEGYYDGGEFWEMDPKIINQMVASLILSGAFGLIYRLTGFDLKRIGQTKEAGFKKIQDYLLDLYGLSTLNSAYDIFVPVSWNKARLNGNSAHFQSAEQALEFLKRDTHLGRAEKYLLSPDNNLSFEERLKLYSLLRLLIK